MPAQQSWTIHNLPAILYQFSPLLTDLNHAEPVLLPYLIFGRRLRDFAGVLPDRISSNVEPYLLETWFRLNSNIQWQDITDRIHPATRPWWNTLQMGRTRFREHFHLRAWGRTRGNFQAARIQALELQLQNAGINLGANTTRGLMPGLVDPQGGPNGWRIPIPQRWLRPRPQRAANTDRLRAQANQRHRSKGN